MSSRVSPRSATLRERLDYYVIPEPNSGCLLWIGAVSSSGYGRVGWLGKQHQAHRMAWVDANGPIPDGLAVCHKCDVPACINVSHLWLGTHTDNMQDMRAKGRGGRKNLRCAAAVPPSSLMPRSKRRTDSICARCGKAYNWRMASARYCSDKCRWDVTRTQEQRDRYNAARNKRRRAATLNRANRPMI